MAASKRSSSTLVIVLGIVTAVVGAVLAAVLLVAKDGGGGAEVSKGTLPVLVAVRPIPRGASGEQVQDSVAVRQVAAVTRASDALTSPEQLVDRTTTTEIGVDQQVRSAFFRQRTVRGSTIKVPEGKQALAVTIDFTPAGAGYIGPGDKVNVYAVYTKQGEGVALENKPVGTAPEFAADKLAFSNIEVLDISQEVAPLATTQTAATPTNGTATRPTAAATTITYLLAVDANQAERLIFFTSYARLYLTLVPQGQGDSATPGRDQTNVLR